MAKDGYHSDYGSVSKTMLNVFYDSPVDYKLIYIDRLKEPKKVTSPMQVGTVCHAVILEGKLFDEVVVPYPEYCLKSNGALNPDRAAEFREEYSEYICMKQGDVDSIAEVVSSLQRSPIASAVAESINCEKRHDAVIHGLACRCKPDIVCDMGNHVLAYDLKFSECVSDVSFRRTSKRLRYWLQDAHYSAILEAEYDKPVVFRFFAVETVFPYRVQSYWYSMRSREIARDSHKRKIIELAGCMESQQWNDRWESEIHLNAWDVDEDDQLIEFGEDDDSAE